MSDNGPQFVSQEFALFIVAKHIPVPVSNGATERQVRFVKQGVWPGLRSGVSFERGIAGVFDPLPDNSPCHHRGSSQ